MNGTWVRLGIGALISALFSGIVFTVTFYVGNLITGQVTAAEGFILLIPMLIFGLAIGAVASLPHSLAVAVILLMVAISTKKSQPRFFVIGGTIGGIIALIHHTHWHRGFLSGVTLSVAELALYGGIAGAAGGWALWKVVEEQEVFRRGDTDV